MHSGVAAAVDASGDCRLQEAPQQSRQRQQDLQRCFLQLVSNAFLVQCEVPVSSQQQKHQHQQQQGGRRRKSDTRTALRKLPSKTADVPVSCP